MVHVHIDMGRPVRQKAQSLVVEIEAFAQLFGLAEVYRREATRSCFLRNGVVAR